MLGVVLLCVFTAGCGVVHTRTPVGIQPRNIASEQEQWEGLWVHANGAVKLTVMDATHGYIRLAWLEDEGERAKARVVTGELRETGKWLFVNIKNPEETNGCAGLYSWGRIERRGRQALVWLPDAAKFRHLVEASALRGTAATNGNDVVLGPLDTAGQKVIVSEAEGVLFLWESPLVFWKMAP
jgi:hypothetical protein